MHAITACYAPPLASLAGTSTIAGCGIAAGRDPRSPHALLRVRPWPYNQYGSPHTHVRSRRGCRGPGASRAQCECVCRERDAHNASGATNVPNANVCTALHGTVCVASEYDG